jgi:hypothetical protein
MGDGQSDNIRLPLELFRVVAMKDRGTCDRLEMAFAWKMLEWLHAGPLSDFPADLPREQGDTEECRKMYVNLEWHQLFLKAVDV